METGSITGYFDVAQLILYVFWGFFAALIYYLHREDKREGYPLVSSRTDRTDRVSVEGFPGVPDAKEFHMEDGSVRLSPPAPNERPIAAEPTEGHPGAPLQPTGNPMLDGVGPAAYAMREDHPDRMLDGLPMIVPMRAAPDFYVEARDTDPRGMNVVGADGVDGGVVSDLWVDRAEPQIRYLEVQLAQGDHVLMPIHYASKIDGARNQIRVGAIHGHQFVDVPRHASSESVTALEEDRISAYYAGGYLYANSERSEPLL